MHDISGQSPGRKIYRPRANTSMPQKGAPSHVWRITYRNPSWKESQGPTTRWFTDQQALDSRLKKLRSETSNRPAAVILRIERIAVSGQWAEVDR